MARCTAPVYGHRSASAAADCPACGGRYGGYRSSYGYYAPRPYYGGGYGNGYGRPYYGGGGYGYGGPSVSFGFGGGRGW